MGAKKGKLDYSPPPLLPLKCVYGAVSSKQSCELYTHTAKQGGKSKGRRHLVEKSFLYNNKIEKINHMALIEQLVEI